MKEKRTGAGFKAKRLWCESRQLLREKLLVAEYVHAKHPGASATGRYRDETLFARSPLRAFAKSSASCSENKSGFQANFNGPCDLQSVSCRDVGGSTDGCRGSVQLVVEKNNSE